MRTNSVRRGSALIAAAMAMGLLGAACAPTTTGGGPVTGNFSFQATSVTVNISNDKTCFIVCVGANDEPYVINIGFTVKIGQANSATSQAVVGDNAWPGIFDQGPGEGQSHTFTGGQQGTVSFPAVPLLDVLDLANTNNHLEIAGVWAWAMEADLLGVSGLATTAAAAIKATLNSTLATGSLPSDTSQIVNTIVSAIGSNIFPALGGLIASIIPFAGDDAIGSRFYVGLGVTGTLKGIIDAATASATIPALAIPVVNDPPDIDGGAIFSLASRSFTGQVMTNGGVDGRHTYSYALTQS